jgi:hypothetical protein
MSYPPGGYGGYPNQGHGGGYGGGQVEHPQGTTVLILGILGIVACQILAPFAWSMGNKALEEVDRDPQRYSNRSLVNTGRILGMVGTIILGIYLVIFVFYIIFVVVLVGTSGTS